MKLSGRAVRQVSSVRTVVYTVRWIVLGAASGALAGGAAFVFLRVLDRLTSFRIHHGWLVYLLPVAAMLVGIGYHVFGGRSARGNSLLLDEIHEPTAWVPRRMAPMVLVGSWVTHLFGGSAGREGTAVQMSGSLSDALARVLRLRPDDRRLLLVASLGGGFGAVFGVPLAGAVFALEVQTIGRVRYDALVPALSASIVGDLVVRGLGYTHHAYLPLVEQLTVALALKVAVAGVAFGLAGLAFVELTHFVAAVVGKLRWPPLRSFVGGVGVIVLFLLFGADYLGLSIPLGLDALAGHGMGIDVSLLKLVFTAVTLGCAMPGGEVTPLFVIGATLGAALAGPLHLPVVAAATLGFVAVFAGASNTPLTCTIMGAELFGSGAVVPMAIACVMAYVFSGNRSIYAAQRVHAGKAGRSIDEETAVGTLRMRRH